LPDLQTVVRTDCSIGLRNDIISTEYRGLRGRNRMNRFRLPAVVLIVICAVLLFASSCLADRSRFLDAALSMLEDGNPFLTRYNEETGAGIKSRYPLGCPYFWGGRQVSKILDPASPNQNSEYYKTNQQYLYGLDCVGFTRWVMNQLGLANHDSISNLLNRTLYKEYVNYRAAKNTGEQRSRYLAYGDLVALQHASGGFHIAMYIGTLMDYGYTAKTLPEELVPYLYYPLVIHCTGSSDYYERYDLFLKEKTDGTILPPYGGVIVSILDVPAAAATDSTADILDLKKPCFNLEGYHLEILDLSREKRERWIRWRLRPE